MITWTEITAECGNYRDGFVGVFRKYEGELTDERDGQGRRVKVTASTFARHFGIEPKTFLRWVAKQEGQRVPLARSANDLTRDVKRAANAEPGAVVDGIMAAPSATQDAIFHDLKLRRAGVDTSKSARKAAEANAHHQTEPIRRAMATAEVPLCVAALHDATEHLQAAITAGVLDDDAMGEITTASDEFQIALAEARMVVP